MTNDIPDEVVARMVALVREMADRDSPTYYYDLFMRARDIAALLPEPVDPDLIEARKIVKACYPEMTEGYNGRRMMVAKSALARGRELAKEGK